jgi:hypothetical protein
VQVRAAGTHVLFAVDGGLRVMTISKEAPLADETVAYSDRFVVRARMMRECP